MSDEGDFIRSALGNEVEGFNYKCGGKRRKGWVRRCLRSEKTFRSDAGSVVKKHQKKFSEKDIRLFIGPGVMEIAPGKFSNSYEVEDPFDPPPNPPSYDQIFALPGLLVL